MFGDRLRLLRQQKNLTQDEVAKALSISRGAYTHYEINKRQPDFALLQKIADFFDVSTDFLLGRVEEKNPMPEVLRDPSLNISYYKGYESLSPQEQEIVKEQIRHTIDALQKLKKSK
ncbi:helix-turn-helix transcriptional regulator [Aneurinibacillus sp. Ricciae_BoGa-3]|uniref:helix-turn-helix domain-containing protein n=1 Tax=Aneurinibacillus sp. Ricciae_BoGa-3 TaxID=3022697 RepID=UPI002340749A|nr:helix-turn-helix transcriptional regulator [Aneurinibacillus sp. Ricciae_BoGa-3]WCK55113.1 helix-turn-helix transcriptional regulator [Aneurinibacillus sp. Ricciae_BoGa-3]